MAGVPNSYEIGRSSSDSLLGADESKAEPSMGHLPGVAKAKAEVKTEAKAAHGRK